MTILPAAHTSQEDAAIAVATVPFGHCAQVVLLRLSAKRPASHGRHSSNAGLVEYVPRLHARQVVRIELLTVPGVQDMHVELPVTFEIVPAKQESHEVDPLDALKRPTLHSSQGRVRLRNMRPGVQTSHDVDRAWGATVFPWHCVHKNELLALEKGPAAHSVQIPERI